MKFGACLDAAKLRRRIMALPPGDLRKHSGLARAALTLDARGRLPRGLVTDAIKNQFRGA